MVGGHNKCRRIRIGEKTKGSFQPHKSNIAYFDVPLIPAAEPQERAHQPEFMDL